MLTVISPAKRLDLKPVDRLYSTLPEFQAAANELVGYARALDVDELQKLMSISQNIARLNVDRFREFDPDPSTENAKQAGLIFAGDTYAGLEAGTFDVDEMAYAQDHLRILSGLYGLLRPLDLIQPYRLEMGSRLKTRKGKSLYDYWGRRISDALNDAAAGAGTDVLVNCASQEYFGAVDVDVLGLRVITPVFLEERNGEAKIVSFFAKKARGAMARFIITRRIADPEGLKDFDIGGYRYDAGRSAGDSWAFLRDYPDT